MVDNTLSTIQETFVLPSKGLIYPTPIKPEITLRSMTTRDEMLRLSGSDQDSLKNLCQMIENCIVGEKPKIHVYDMCLGDYEFLLHKLRLVTYGSEYKMLIKCPNCGEVSNASVDLDKEVVREYDDSFKELLKVHLPVSNIDVELTYQTPRMYDEIQKRIKELKSKNPDSLDPSLTVSMEKVITTIDGEAVNPVKVEFWIAGLPLRDYNVLVQSAEKINRKVGLEGSVIAKCGQCGYELVTSFRIGQEFFRPSID